MVIDFPKNKPLDETRERTNQALSGAYKVTGFYAPEADRGIAWNDPDIAIDWPIDTDTVILSDKDGKHPTLADSPAVFPYEEFSQNQQGELA